MTVAMEVARPLIEGEKISPSSVSVTKGCRVRCRLGVNGDMSSGLVLVP